MRRPGKDPPSKKRYDRRKPVVSFRVSKEELDKLDKMREGSGLSRGQFLKRTFGLEFENERQILEKEYVKGFQKAKEIHAIYVTCDGCGKPIHIEPRLQAALDYALKQTYDLFHIDCVPQIPRRQLMKF